MATGSGLRLVPLPAADFEAWRAVVTDRLAGLRAASGAMSTAAAGARAEATLTRLLPAGVRTPDHHLWLIRDDAATDAAGADDDGTDQDGTDQDGADQDGTDQDGANRDGAGGAGAVGHLWLRVRTVSDGVEAFVFDLWVTPDADSRGLGRPAALLAEQQARALGADVVRLNISRLDAMTMRMIEGLGYEATASQMILDLRQESATVDAGGPGAVELRPMTQVRFDAFCATQVAGYAADIEGSGSASAAEAQAKAVADFAELLPEGLRSPGQLLWSAHAGEDDVGWLWLQVRAEPDDHPEDHPDTRPDDHRDPPSNTGTDFRSGRTDVDAHGGADSRTARAFVLDIEVRPEFRRRGHARSIMRGAERESRVRGAVSIGLSVFGDNHGARALYDSLGYRPTEELLRKTL